MDRKNTRLYLYVLVCGVLGVILGGTTSRAQMNQCILEDTPTSSCLTQNPWAETAEGMSMGLIAGTGAAVGATWQLWRKGD